MQEPTEFTIRAVCLQFIQPALVFFRTIHIYDPITSASSTMCFDSLKKQKILAEILIQTGRF